MSPVVNPQEIEVRLYHRLLHGDDVFPFRDRLEIEVRPGRFEPLEFAVDTFEQYSVLSLDLAKAIELFPASATFRQDFFQDIYFTFPGFPLKFSCKCRIVTHSFKRFRLALRDILPHFELGFKTWPYSLLQFKLKRPNLRQPR
jgi:hypothetical protein